MRFYALLALIITLISFDAQAIDSRRYQALMESIDDAAFSDDKLAVSYTHLTLPTICSV